MLVLCGPAATGKDAIRAELLKFGLVPVVDYTTRPIRDGEKDGVNYHYVSERVFRTKERNGDFAAAATYLTAYGVWSYGTDKHDIAEDKVAITNPFGVKSIRNLGYSVYVAGISVPEEIAIQRLQDRNWSREELNGRIGRDRKHFADMHEFCDSIITNDGTASPEEIAGQICAVYRQWLSEQQIRSPKKASEILSPLII